MAPDTVAHWLESLPKRAKILDPMCGSGVVLRQAAMLDHEAIGFDIDPLAVLMSSVWTRRTIQPHIRELGVEIVKGARRYRKTHLDLPWVNTCNETREFIEYWFEEGQRNDLASLVAAISRRSTDSKITQIFRLAVSRIIVTKHAGASVAWDTSHSRPHRMIQGNDYDVLDGFSRSLDRLVDILQAERPKRSAKVNEGDCRDLSLKDGAVDAVITSPPYLNAIDYLRGHKLSLVWFGHTIPALRARRSGAVGTERARPPLTASLFSLPELMNGMGKIDTLPKRQLSIVHKYAVDADAVMAEIHRVLTKGGLMVLVLGDSHLRGHNIPNSKIFQKLAENRGFKLVEEKRRPLVESRRYLPIHTTSDLSKRMKYEVVQAYRKSA
jgi:SAM-dependent methyltransferase